jgi:hypothetical protein
MNDQPNITEETATRQRIMPLAYSASGAMAGVSPRFSMQMQEEMVAQAAAIEEKIYEIANTAVDEAAEVAEELRGALEETGRAMGTTFGSVAAAMTDRSTALNAFFINAIRAQVAEGLNLVQQLAGARDPAEALSIQASYVHRQMTLVAEQTAEMRDLSEKLVEEATKPLTNAFLRSAQRFRSC